MKEYQRISRPTARSRPTLPLWSTSPWQWMHYICNNGSLLPTLRVATEELPNYNRRIA